MTIHDLETGDRFTFMPRVRLTVIPWLETYGEDSAFRDVTTFRAMIGMVESDIVEIEELLPDLVGVHAELHEEARNDIAAANAILTKLRKRLEDITEG